MGLLIAFEGADGTGKTTTMRNVSIAAALQPNECWKFPSRTGPIGEKIHEFLINKNDKTGTVDDLAKWCCDDRRCHTPDITEALKTRHVLTGKVQV